MTNKTSIAMKIIDEAYEDGCHSIDAYTLAKEICHLFPKTPDNPDGGEPQPSRRRITGRRRAELVSAYSQSPAHSHCQLQG